MIIFDKFTSIFTVYYYRLFYEEKDDVKNRRMIEIIRMFVSFANWWLIINMKFILILRHFITTHRSSRVTRRAQQMIALTNSKETKDRKRERETEKKHTMRN